MSAARTARRALRTGALVRGTALITTLLAVGAVARAQDTEPVLVLTSLPVTYSITSALAAGTRITVHNVPAGGRTLGAQASFFERQAESLAADFERAAAVVTIGKLWRDDPLYLAARNANIRVVDIDATKPWSTSLEGVGVVLEPVADVPWADPAPAERSPSTYFWLSPANGARAAEIVATDLARLVPAEARQIHANLLTFRRDVLELKREYEVAFASLLDVTVFALAPEFVYLTTDMGLYVDGQFFKQDIDWSDDDRAALTEYLAERDIRVVIHKWSPDPAILAAIAGAGARLVVLDTLETGIVADGVLAPGSYLAILRRNLDALYQALAAN